MGQVFTVYGFVSVSNRPFQQNDGFSLHGFPSPHRPNFLTGFSLEIDPILLHMKKLSQSQLHRRLIWQKLWQLGMDNDIGIDQRPAEGFDQSDHIGQKS